MTDTHRDSPLSLPRIGPEPSGPADVHESRSRELDLLLATITSGTRVTAIVGLPGVGKTWLLDALAAKLTRPKVRIDWPDRLEALLPSALSKLAGVAPGTVLLLDDAPADGLTSLVAALTGLDLQLVVASRRRPTIDASLVDVTSLVLPTTPDSAPTAPATRLLADLIVAADPGHAPQSLADWALIADIATTADGFPGALVLAAEASRLMDLATLANRSRAEPVNIFGPIIASITRELASSVDPDLAAVRRLAECVDGALPVTAESLVEDLASNTEHRLAGPLGLLARLRDRHLLVRRETRLVVPPLVRLALLALPSSEPGSHPPQTAFALRLAAHAEGVTRNALRYGRSAPLEWIGAERNNLRAALRTLVDTHPGPAWHLTSALLTEIWRCISPPDSTLRHELLDLVDRLLGGLLSRPLGDEPDDRAPIEDAPIEALSQVVRTLFDFRDRQRLMRCVAVLHQRAPGSFEWCWAVTAVAIIDNAPNVAELARASIAAATARRDPLAEAKGHLLCSSALHLVAPDEARHHAETALAMFEACTNDWGRATALGNLGYFAMIRGAIDETRRYARESVAVAELSRDRRNLSNALGNLGLLELDWGRTSEARELLNRSYALHQESLRPDFMAACLVGLARVVLESVGPTQVSADEARALDDAERALLELERMFSPSDRRFHHLESALVRAELHLSRADPKAALATLDEVLAYPELADLPNEALLLNARRAALAPSTSATHRVAVDDLLSRADHAPRITAAKVYSALWCPDAEWADLARDLGRLVRVPLAGTPPQGLGPAWHNSAIVRAALRTTWPLLSDVRRQDIEAEARDPEQVHLVVSTSTGRLRMPRHTTWSDVGKRPLLMRLLELLIEGHERGVLLDEVSLGESLWPGERMLPEARANRIQNAVSLLRKAGLKDHLERPVDAYRIDPSLTIIVVRGALDALS